MVDNQTFISARPQHPVMSDAHDTTCPFADFAISGHSI